MTDLTAIDEVENIEQWIRQQPQLEIDTRHYLAGGVYEREIIIPAGSLITGKIHLTEHLAKLVKGTLTIYSESDKGTFTGPLTFVSKPGAKRVGYAHDECVFSTFHAVGGETDVLAIEQALVVDTAEEYKLRLEDKGCHSLQQEQH